jgi:hypothetical protein
MWIPRRDGLDCGLDSDLLGLLVKQFAHIGVRESGYFPKCAVRVNQVGHLFRGLVLDLFSHMLDHHRLLAGLNLSILSSCSVKGTSVRQSRLKLSVCHRRLPINSGPFEKLNRGVLDPDHLHETEGA